jgi:hypothetical protein
LEEDLKRWNVPAEQRQILLGDAGDEIEPPEFEVWPDNWPTVSVFVAMSTQWNCAAGMTAVVRLGLRYEALSTVMTCLAIDGGQHSEIFGGLRLMESAALEVLNAK